ncbi:MAG: ABC transporter permease [Acidobacteria bacterium]|nr:MAG: ABC transporter permease [Acidobacteriota bacterium]
MRPPLGRAARRLAAAALTVALTTFLAYAALALLPGDPLAGAVPPELAARLDAGQRAELAHRLGLDRPLLVRYLDWARRAARGDLGRSIRTGRPVADDIAGRIGATVELNLAALALVAAAGLPLGWGAARWRGRAAERLAGGALVALYALPAFWIAMLAQQLFAVRLGWLPLYGRTPAGAEAGPAARLAHLVLPAACLALHGLAFYARFARDTALEGLASAHALAARALGLPESQVFRRHAVRPSLVPLATLAGLLVPSLATGSVLIETLFAWPGVGRLYVQAVAARDVPVVMALTAIVALLTVAGSLLADLGAAAADPRLRAGGGPGG